MLSRLSSSRLISSSIIMSRTMSTSTTTTTTTTTASIIKDYTKYMSQTALLREPSPIRALIPLSLIPGMLSLGGGLPNDKLFPFQSLSFTLHDGRTIQLTEQELAESLQYSATPGLPCLLKILTDMQRTEHKPPVPDNTWSVCVTVGSQDALTKCFEMLLSPGDSILVDDPTYTGAISYLKPLGANMVGLRTDALGVIPESLAEALASWPSSTPKPRVLYTIPTGQNPAGSTSSYARKKAIYALACQHDLIIMEDDPYYYLYYGEKPAPTTDSPPFHRPELKSYWSLDTQGRVIRFDSFSKNLSSGLRLGYATGPKALIDGINLTTQATNLHPSGISQMLAYKYLSTIGLDGWRKQTDAVSLFYARRRDHFMSLCSKHLTGLAEWDAPTAGMFVWFKLKGIKDTKAMIEKKAIDAKVILIWGNAFSPSNSPSSYVRASFSIATPEQQDEALRRFAQLIRDELAAQKQSKL